MMETEMTEDTPALNRIGLRWEPATGGKAMLADLNIQYGPLTKGSYYGSYRYLVRRQRPHSREWVARRDGYEFAGKTFTSQEQAIEACEVDAERGPASAVSLTRMQSLIDLRKVS